MKQLLSLCALVALISCCALAAATSGAPPAPAAPQPAPQSATVDLSSFGAVGDGVTDDGPAIKRALDALADAGGGTLTVPSGRFAIITPVDKDFRGKAANITIRGVPSSVNPDPKGGGNVLSTGLGLVSEFVVKTGPHANALAIRGLDTFLITDIVFIGTQAATTDARVSLGLFAIRDATVHHCEFYGLSTLVEGGAVIYALESGLTVDKSVFLGSTGSSAHRTPVVQNVSWKKIVMTQSIFIDYGQRGNYYGKLHLAAPFSWVMIGNPSPATNLSPRREASFRNVFFDEGAFIGVSSILDYYDPSSKPADLIHISDFRMNVSSLNAGGIHINRGSRNTLIERGEFMLTRAANYAVDLVNAGDVILDKLICGADADTIRADYQTRRLAVINSTYKHLESQAQSTKVINSTDPDKDPVQYVRQRFLSTLSREADPAANYFWADLILRCDDVAACVTARRNELSAYLAASPAPTFSVSGRATKDNGSGLSGVTVNLSGSQTVSAAANASGDYTFAGLPTSGDYTLTPARINYTFTPASQAVSRPAGNRTVNFAGKANRYRITGRLANAAGAPIVGATVALSGTETGTATTDSAGNYSLGVGAEGTYTVTPARANYTFSPAGRTFTSVTADQTANFTGALVSYTISGRVTEGASGLAGVTVTLSGSLAGTKTTDAAGNYSFTAVAEGNYTVTAARTRYTFAPPSVTLNNLSGNRTADFGATLNRHAVRGKVKDASGAPLSGVTVSLSGSQTGTTTTDPEGNYALLNLPAGGNYTVTPARTNYTFAPASRTLSDLSSDQTADFTGTLITYKISGRVLNINNTGIPGATVSLSGTTAGTATTDGNGAYTFAGLSVGGTYTVTPSLAHHDFTPPSRTFANLQSDQAANFVADFTNYTISGRVTEGGNALSGVTVTLSGTKSGTTTTGADGRYSFAAQAHGTYTVTPARTHYTFAPAAHVFYDLLANQTIDFAAAPVSYTISGRVTASGSGLAGVTVTLSGSTAGTRTTDAAGNYSFSVAGGGNYTVTPSRTNYVFTPASTSFNNLSANSAADFAGIFVTYKITGRVTSGGAGLGGVTLNLGGSHSAQTTSAPDGTYSFNVAAGGNYTVTPARTHYAFTPASAAFNNLSANQTADFAGTLVAYKISGRVLTPGGAALSGVSVALGGSQTATTNTDAAGNYSFNATALGDYTVTPSKPNYSFTPASASLADLAGNAAADFTGSPVSYRIAGRITGQDGTPLGGTAVALSGSQTGTANTDANGNYSFNVAAEGTYTVTPARANYTFSPASRTFTSVTADQTADFTGATAGFKITGRVTTVGGAALSGVTLTLSGASAGTTATDANGAYTFAGLSVGGAYTVTPALAHYEMTPASRTVSNLQSDQAADFVADFTNYTISGRVTASGNALSGVTVTLSGTQSGTASTDADGRYSFAAQARGTYTVTPALAGYAFSPTSQTFNDLVANQSADFAATQNRNIGFAAATFNASEAAGTVTVTVVRTGDTSEAAEVVVSAADGSADQRTDLSPVIAAVSFAPGEASKTVVLFITDDAYQEGAEQLTLLLSGAVGGTLSAQNTATLTIADNDSAPAAANPLDDARFFVRQHYLDFLGREPDDEGMAFWSGQILSCGTDPGCAEEKRINVSAAFFLAIEFQETGYFVHRLYKATYARAPRHVEEFLLDSRQVGHGLVVNAPGWKELLEDNKSEFARVFVEREDFRDAYPLALTPAEFVSSLNERAGSPLAPAELAAAVAEFAGAPTSADPDARSRALRRVVESDALRRRELNAAFVLMQYFGYLQRNPDDPPNTDLSGYNFWLTKLEEHGGDHRAAQMVRSFLVSGEYRARFGR